MSFPVKLLLIPLAVFLALLVQVIAFICTRAVLNMTKKAQENKIDRSQAAAAENKVDPEIIRSIPAGSFFLCVSDRGRPLGYLTQGLSVITKEPFRLGLALDKDSRAHALLWNTGECTVSLLAEDTSPAFADRFSDKKGAIIDDITEQDFSPAAGSLLYCRDSSCCMTLTTIKTLDCYSHTLFLMTVTETCRSK